MPDAASQNPQPPMEPEKLDLRSMDIAEAKRQELLRLFPEIRTEGGKLDFDRLKLALGEAVDVGRERYGMNWPGKADCFKTIQTPSMGTLRPCPEESVNWDTTGNLIIEGDNLEVLKLLQKSYLGKVKMIYIDPSYNTGNDFIYPDNSTESLATYLAYTGQADVSGKRFGTNSESEGRFHTNWLNALYPRLYLARNLLREDGVIFVSIDDHEIDNLLKVCFEVFGEENWVATLVWEKKKKGAFLSGDITSVKEYVVVCTRTKSAFDGLLGEIATQTETYPVIKTTNTRGERTIPAGIVSKYREPNHNLPKGSRISSGNMELILLDPLIIKNGRLASSVRVDSNWIYSQALIDEYASKGELYITQDLYFRRIVTDPRRKRLKDLLPREGESGTSSPEFVLSDDLFADGWGTNEDGFDELHELTGHQNILDFPKPSKLIAKLALSATREDRSAIILDFYAGSGTTAHAVMDLNRQDGGGEEVHPRSAARAIGHQRR
jgi:adenine-specific DNA-methyltransferase